MKLFLINICLRLLMFTICDIGNSKRSAVYSQTFPATTDCMYNEVVLIIDVSQTIQNTDLAEAKRFSQKLIEDIDITTGSRVAVVIFAKDAQKKVYCNQYQTKEQLSQAVRDISRGSLDTTLTNLEAGLITGYEILNEQGCGKRKRHYQKTMVLISDGRANYGRKQRQGVLDEAKRIRETGVKIVAVAVGKRVNLVLLSEVVGGNRDRIVMRENFDGFLFNGTADMISRQLCHKNKMSLSTSKATPLETSRRFCKCSMEDNLKNISKMFREEEVITKYTGACYIAKVEQALKEAQQLLEKINQENSKDVFCLQILRFVIMSSQLSDKNVEELFTNYSKCLVVECHMKTAEDALQERMRFLKREMTCQSCTRLL